METNTKDGLRFLCTKCGKVYKFKRNCMRHMRYECSDVEPCFPCPYCNYKGKQKVTLRSHVYHKHKGKYHEFAVHIKGKIHTDIV